jgi:hypothetical protein
MKRITRSVFIWNLLSREGGLERLMAAVMQCSHDALINSPACCAGNSSEFA